MYSTNDPTTAQFQSFESEIAKEPSSSAFQTYDNAETNLQFFVTDDNLNFYPVSSTDVEPLLSDGVTVYTIDPSRFVQNNEPNVDIGAVAYQVVDTSTVLLEKPSEIIVLQSETDQIDSQNNNILVQNLCDQNVATTRQDDTVVVSCQSQANKEFVCLVCRSTFESGKLLKQHMVEHGNEKPFICDQCPSRFNFDVNLIVHKASQHTDPQSGSFHCKLCSCRLNRFTAFKSHLRIHQVTDLLNCRLCNQMFESQSLLTAHKKEPCNASPTFHCRNCSKSFDNLSLMRQHYTQSHPEISRNNRINRLVTTVKSGKLQPIEPLVVKRKTPIPLSDLNQYIRELSDEGSVTQPTLSSETSSSINPDQDGLIPDSNRKRPGPKKRPSYHCPTCNKAFRRPCHLKSHLRQHSGFKPFQCVLCDARFSQKSSVKTHIISMHSTESTYGCPLCQRQFNYHGNLIAHLDRHKVPVECHTNSSHFKQKPPLVVDDAQLNNTNRPIHHQDITSAPSAVHLLPTTNVSNSFVHIASAPTVIASVDQPGSERFDPPILPSTNVYTTQSLVQCDYNQSYHISDSYYINQVTTTDGIRPLKWCNQSRAYIDPSSVKRATGPFGCNYCPKFYSSSSHLRFHVRQKHPTCLLQSSQFVCDHCKRAFSSRLTLNRHIERIHNSRNVSRRLFCHRCSTMVTSRRHFTIVHSDAKTFKCPLCDKYFKFSSSCQKHIKRKHHQDWNSSQVESHYYTSYPISTNENTAYQTNYQTTFTQSNHHDFSNQSQLIVPNEQLPVNNGSYSQVSALPLSQEKPDYANNQNFIVAPASDQLTNQQVYDYFPVQHHQQQQFMSKQPQSLATQVPDTVLLYTTATDGASHLKLPKANLMLDSNNKSSGIALATTVDLDDNQLINDTFLVMPSSDAVLDSNMVWCQLQTTEKSPQPLLFGCALCKTGFESSDALSDHCCEKQRPYDSRPASLDLLICQTCNRRFTLPSMLACHEVACQQQKPLSCPLCATGLSPSFTNKSRLTKHLLVKHSPNDLATLLDQKHDVGHDQTSFMCMQCRQTFRLLRSLQLHIRTMHDRSADNRQGMKQECVELVNGVSQHQWNQVLPSNDNVIPSSSTLIEADTYQSTTTSNHQHQTEAANQQPLAVYQTSNAPLTNPYLDNFLANAESYQAQHPHQTTTFNSVCYQPHNGDPVGHDESPLSASSQRNDQIAQVGPTLPTTTNSGGSRKTTTGSLAPTRTRLQAIHKCPVCDKQFNARWTLLRHTTTVHPGARPYECTNCLVRFSQQSSLLRHVAVAHPTNEGDQRPLFKCKKCRTTFTQRYNLKRHARRCRYAVVRDETTPL